MPCYPIKANGMHGYVCGRLGPRCRVCGSVSGFLCDFPVGHHKTCDAPLCTEHAREVAPDVHYCPGHHQTWAEFRDPGTLEASLASIPPRQQQLWEEP